jgi:hypothetical protein
MRDRAQARRGSPVYLSTDPAQIDPPTTSIAQWPGGTTRLKPPGPRRGLLIDNAPTAGPTSRHPQGGGTHPLQRLPLRCPTCGALGGRQPPTLVTKAARSADSTRASWPGKYRFTLLGVHPGSSGRYVQAPAERTRSPGAIACPRPSARLGGPLHASGSPHRLSVPHRGSLRWTTGQGLERGALWRRSRGRWRLNDSPAVGDHGRSACCAVCTSGRRRGGEGDGYRLRVRWRSQCAEGTRTTRSRSSVAWRAQ